MALYSISYVIDGLLDVIPEKTSRLTVNDILFHYRENEVVGTANLESNGNDILKVQKQAIHLIDKALAKICFAYNTEAILKTDAIYSIDLTNNPGTEKASGIFVIRMGFVSENPEVTLAKINMLPFNRQEVLDLALAYYKLSYAKNPLRIESLFSSMTAIIRDVIGQDYIDTQTFKNELKSKLKKQNTNFDELGFEHIWKNCYADERCSIAHGRGSKLVDIRNPFEYDNLVREIASWTRQVIYSYINNYQNAEL
jgi:hypothetical protein